MTEYIKKCKSEAEVQEGIRNLKNFSTIPFLLLI